MNERALDLDHETIPAVGAIGRTLRTVTGGLQLYNVWSAVAYFSALRHMPFENQPLDRWETGGPTRQYRWDQRVFVSRFRFWLIDLISQTGANNFRRRTLFSLKEFLIEKNRFYVKAQAARLIKPVCFTLLCKILEDHTDLL
jgi:hypothetical protein